MAIFGASKEEIQKLKDTLDQRLSMLESKLSDLSIKQTKTERMCQEATEELTVIRVDINSINKIIKDTVGVEKIEQKNIERLRDDIHELRTMIKDPKRREVLIIQDKEVVALRKEFDELKKKVLMADE